MCFVTRDRQTDNLVNGGRSLTKMTDQSDVYRRGAQPDQVPAELPWHRIRSRLSSQTSGLLCGTETHSLLLL